MSNLQLSMRSIFAVFVALLFCTNGCTERQTENVEPSTTTSEPALLDVGISLPLELEVRILNKNEKTVFRHVQVTFSPKVKDLQVSIEMKLPDGATLAQGSTTWNGQLPEGKRKSFEFILRLPDLKPGFIVAKASVTQPNGKSFNQAASAYFDPQRLQKELTTTRPVQGYNGAQQIQVHRGKPSSDK